MATITTKTIRDFKGKGFYNPETQVFTKEKDGEDVYLPDVLSALSKDGELISISIKHEDSVEESLKDIQGEE